MRHAISKNLREFIAVIVMVFIALGVGGYILSNQRFYLPAWVPVLGTDFFELKAQFSTAQSVTPGPGPDRRHSGRPGGGDQARRAGRRPRGGDDGDPRQVRGHDQARRDHAPAAEDRPQGHGDRGRPRHAGAAGVPEGYTIPVSQTRPDVNLDEILANLDRDTRDYLRLLVAGGGEALKDNGPAFRNAFRRFEPLGRDRREAHEAARASGARTSRGWSTTSSCS